MRRGADRPRMRPAPEGGAVAPQLTSGHPELAGFFQMPLMAT